MIAVEQLQKELQTSPMYAKFLKQFPFATGEEMDLPDI
jgi:hypothetical protein